MTVPTMADIGEPESNVVDTTVNGEESSDTGVVESPGTHVEETGDTDTPKDKKMKLKDVKGLEGESPISDAAIKTKDMNNSAEVRQDPDGANDTETNNSDLSYKTTENNNNNNNGNIEVNTSDNGVINDEVTEEEKVNGYEDNNGDAVETDVDPALDPMLGVGQGPQMMDDPGGMMYQHPHMGPHYGPIHHHHHHHHQGVPGAPGMGAVPMGGATPPAMHSPQGQMGAFGPNGSTAGPCRFHHHPPTTGPPGAASPPILGASRPDLLAYTSPVTPPQSGTSSPSPGSGGQGANSTTGPPHQHVVHVHINPGETITVKVDDQYQQITGNTLYTLSKRLVSSRTDPQLSIMIILLQFMVKFNPIDCYCQVTI